MEQQEIKKAIAALESFVKDPSIGLPLELFLFASRITPIINVDLLIQDERRQTLLTWRDDGYNSPGWHIPGGIIRYKETIADRIHAVAAGELGTRVEFKNHPLVINEVIVPPQNRGHSISLLYKCTLVSPLDNGRKFMHGVPLPGQWAWHVRCPDNLIAVHHMYRKFL